MSPYIVRPITYLAGNNSLVVTLNGDPGSFVTVVVMHGGLPDVSAGRLLLPWASATNFALDLKNGSHTFDRQAVIVVYDANGRSRPPRRSSTSRQPERGCPTARTT